MTHTCQHPDCPSSKGEMTPFSVFPKAHHCVGYDNIWGLYEYWHAPGARLLVWRERNLFRVYKWTVVLDDHKYIGATFQEAYRRAEDAAEGDILLKVAWKMSHTDDAGRQRVYNELFNLVD